MATLERPFPFQSTSTPEPYLDDELSGLTPSASPAAVPSPFPIEELDKLRDHHIHDGEHGELLEVRLFLATVRGRRAR
jgi:hypothetical protein